MFFLFNLKANGVLFEVKYELIEENKFERENFSNNSVNGTRFLY